MRSNRRDPASSYRYLQGRYLPGADSPRITSLRKSSVEVARSYMMPARMNSSASRSGGIAGQADAAELPARIRREEVAIGPARMAARSSARCAPQDHLVAHELTVVFTERPGRRPIARIGDVGA